MQRLIKQIIRLLMVKVHPAQKQSRRSRNVEGGLLVSVSTQTSGSLTDHLRCTVAAAGYWCSGCTMENIQYEVMQILASSISITFPADPEELSEFVDKCGPLHFHMSFQMSGNGQDSRGWLKTEQFLHRLSLVHAQVEIYFTLKINEVVSRKVFGCRADRRFMLMGRCMVTDSALYLLPAVSAGPDVRCTQLHLSPGEATPLMLPQTLMEMGVCGSTSLLPASALSPCMVQYPNWPARLIDICILLYGPYNLPLLCDGDEPPLSFLCDLTHLLSWKEFGLSGVQCSENSAKAGRLQTEMIYTIDGGEEDEAVGQTLLLFLFLQHSDPFCSQLSDFVASEEILVQNLDRILQHNRETVKSALCSLLQSTLSGSLKRQKAHRKMEEAIPVILSSLSSVVSSSSNLSFRTSCLESMKVQDTRELGITLKQALVKVTQNRFTPSRKCNSKRLPRASGDWDVDGSDCRQAALRQDNSSRRMTTALPHHSTVELGRDGPHGETGGWSIPEKRPRVSGPTAHPSSDKQTHRGHRKTAPEIPHLSQRQVVCSGPAHCSTDLDHQEEDDVWLNMCDWEC